MVYNKKYLLDGSLSRIAVICKTIKNLLENCEVNGFGDLTDNRDLEELDDYTNLLNAEIKILFKGKDEEEKQEITDFIKSRYFSDYYKRFNFSHNCFNFMISMF